jgi:hypothetical protein
MLTSQTRAFFIVTAVKTSSPVIYLKTRSFGGGLCHRLQVEYNQMDATEKKTDFCMKTESNQFPPEVGEKIRL